VGRLATSVEVPSTSKGTARNREVQTKEEVEAIVKDPRREIRILVSFLQIQMILVVLRCVTLHVDGIDALMMESHDLGAPNVS